MLEKIKQYRLKNGIRLEDYLLKKHSNFRYEWSQTGNIIAFLVFVPGLRSPKIYRWEIEGENFYATNGSSNELTPELNKRIQEIQENKRRVPLEQLRIYNFIKQYHLEEDQPIEIVLDKANKEFGLSQGDIEAIYIKVEKMLYL